jgi:hypothetical protein
MPRGSRNFLLIAATIWAFTFGLVLTQREASAAPAEFPALFPQSDPSDTLIMTPMVSGPQCKANPQLVAEGSNSCEIVSCGMGIKDTCKITCPADKTPKCSCDCLKTFGPICTEYKAICKCE